MSGLDWVLLALVVVVFTVARVNRCMLDLTQDDENTTHA